MGIYSEFFTLIFLCSCLLLCDAQYTKKAISAKFNPCHSRGCGTGKECRIQERNCSRIQCPLKTTCVNVNQPNVRCFVGKPILDRHGQEKQCQSTRDCSSYAHCVTARYSGKGSLNLSSVCCWRGWSFRKTRANTTPRLRSNLRELILHDYSIERASFNFSSSQFARDFRAGFSNHTSVHQPEYLASHSVHPNFYADISSGPMANSDTKSNISFRASLRRRHLVNTHVSGNQHSNITATHIPSSTNSRADIDNDLKFNRSVLQQTQNPIQPTVEPTSIQGKPIVAGSTNRLPPGSSTAVPGIFRIEQDTNQGTNTPEKMQNRTQLETQSVGKMGPLSSMDSSGTEKSQPLDYEPTTTQLPKVLRETYPGNSSVSSDPIQTSTFNFNVPTDSGTTNPFKTPAPTIPSDILTMSYPTYLPTLSNISNAFNSSDVPEMLPSTTSSTGVYNSHFLNSSDILNPSIKSFNTTRQGSDNPGHPITMESATFIENSTTLKTFPSANSSIITVAAPGLASEIYHTPVTSSNGNADGTKVKQNISLNVNTSLDKSSSFGEKSISQTLTEHTTHSNGDHHRKRRSGSGYIQEIYGISSETFPEPGVLGVFGTNEHEPGVEVPLEKPGQCSRMVMGKWSSRCMDTCFNDADCPFSQKCCNNGCAKSCQMVTSILNLRSAPSKLGRCPKPGISGEVSRCFGKTCKRDTECPGQLKCCTSLGCGMICKPPK